MPKENTAAEADGASTPPSVGMVFAGGDQIVEEDNGDIFTVQEDIPVPDTPPVEPPPVAETPASPVADPKAGDVGGEAPPPTPEGSDKPVDAPDKPVDPAPLVAESANVPSFRLAQETARRRTAEAELLELRQRLSDEARRAPVADPPQPAASGESAPTPAQLELDFGDDPKQMFDKALDGDMGKATELFSQMMKKTAEEANRVAAPSPGAQPATSDKDIQNLVESRVIAHRHMEAEGKIIDRLEATYGFYNPNSPEFKKDIVDETLALKNAYVMQNYTPADALERAAHVTMLANGLVAAASGGLDGESVAAAAAPDPKTIQRNVDAANATPPEMPKGEPRLAGELDVMSLTDDDIEGLPAATIARLRGDTL